jgi:hypothetical protein
LLKAGRDAIPHDTKPRSEVRTIMTKLNVTLAATALFALTSLIGCKSDYEKYADDSCGCKDTKCLKEVSEKYKSLLGGEKTKLKDLEEKLKALPESDQKAFGRGMECTMKIAMAEAK